MGKGSRRYNNNDWLGTLIGIIIGAAVGLTCFLFCLCPSTRKVRIALTWFWVVALGITVGCCIGLVLFGSTDHLLRSEEEILISGKPSGGLFCEEMAASSNRKTNFYFMTEKPGISDAKFESNYRMDVNGYLAKNEYKIFLFNLLEGTEVRSLINMGSFSALEFFVVKGDHNMQSWKSKKYNHQRQNAAEIFRQMYGRDDWKFKINETAQYYFVYASFYVSTSINSAYLLTNRTRYNLSNSTVKHACTNATSCSFSLTSSENTPYLVVGAESLATNTNTTVATTAILKNNTFNTDSLEFMTFRSTYSARAWPYVVFFAILPVVCGVIVSIMIWSFCKDCDNPCCSSDDNETTPDSAVDAGAGVPASTINAQSTQPHTNQAYAPPEYPGPPATAPVQPSALTNPDYFQSNYGVQYGGFDSLNNSDPPPPSYTDAVSKM